MADSGEFKALVRYRMDATGETYNQAYRALLRAAEREVLPFTGRRILPRIAATSPGAPGDVYVEITSKFRLELDDDELAQYVEADAADREELVENWLIERLDQFILDGAILDHGVMSANLINDNFARGQADYLGITPDQYLWLSDRLTTEEFESLSDDAMHRLLADEYRPYQAPDKQ